MTDVIIAIVYAQGWLGTWLYLNIHGKDALYASFSLNREKRPVVYGFCLTIMSFFWCVWLVIGAMRMVDKKAGL
jgi:hypothetical protein